MVKKDVAMVKKFFIDNKGRCTGAYLFIAGIDRDVLVSVGWNMQQNLLDTFVVGDIIEYEDKYESTHNYKILRNISHEERLQNFNKIREQYKKMLTKER